MNTDAWLVYNNPMLEKVIASFSTKRELLEYGKKHQINADQVVVSNQTYPQGYVFMGWDEIESF